MLLWVLVLCFLGYNVHPDQPNDIMDAIGILNSALPALSADLNPIEHAWNRLQRVLQSLSSPPTNNETIEKFASTTLKAKVCILIILYSACKHVAKLCFNLSVAYLFFFLLSV